jgi:anti-anti-sigma factor
MLKLWFLFKWEDRAMRVKREKKGEVTVLRPEGKLTIGEDEKRFRDALDETPGGKILVDMEKVSFIDASGIGELVGCQATVQNRGGTMKLVHLTRTVCQSLQITCVLDAFAIFKNEEEALLSFS